MTLTKLEMKWLSVFCIVVPHLKKLSEVRELENEGETNIENVKYIEMMPTRNFGIRIWNCIDIKQGSSVFIFFSALAMLSNGYE